MLGAVLVLSLLGLSPKWQQLRTNHKRSEK